MDNLGTTSKRVFLETFGCQMNENDTDRMLGLLKEIRYVKTDSPEKADLIIINTCSIRDKAEQKVYSTIGRLKTLKGQNPRLIIGVGGCVAQQEGAALLKRAPYLDLVFGPHNIHRIKDLLNEITEEKKRVVATSLAEHIGPDEYGYAPAEGGVKAFVSIMRGCNNFCAYCIVPYTRGREVSRKSADIIDEVRRLADARVKEVTLLGQNVNSYGTSGGGDVSFPGLLRLVAGIEGIKRVRFVTSHPKDISDELICLFGEEGKLCRHMHLPVQSGSDAVLNAMGRGYTRREYASKADRLKNLYPDMAITSDIIVGFPGETERDFKDTMDMIADIRFDNIFSFMYSPRPGTRAESFGGHIPFEVKSERLRMLQEAQREITAEKMSALVGETLEVLVEGPSKADPGEVMGRTGCGRIINFPPHGADTEDARKKLYGGMLEVLVIDAYPNSLRGMIPHALTWNKRRSSHEPEDEGIRDNHRPFHERTHSDT